MNASESEEDSCNERTALMSTESPCVQPYDRLCEPPQDTNSARVSGRSPGEVNTHQPSVNLRFCLNA